MASLHSHTSESEKSRSTSVIGSISTYFFPPAKHSSRNHLKKAIFIHKSSLFILRVSLLVYCLMTLVFTASLAKGYRDFLKISFWSFALLTLYLFLAIKSSSAKSHSSFFYKCSGFAIVIYEIAFSLQFVSFLLYCVFIFPKIFSMDFQKNLIQILKDFNLYVLGFVAAWLEQSFNMIKFNPRHIWFLFLTMAINIVIAYPLSVCPHVLVFEFDLSFKSLQILLLVVAFMLTPILHFVLGDLHSKFKYKRHIEKRKKIRERLLSKKFLKDSNISVYYV